MWLQVMKYILFIFIFNSLIYCHSEKKENQNEKSKNCRTKNYELVNVTFLKLQDMGYDIDSLSVNFNFSLMTLEELKKQDPFGNLISKEEEIMLKRMSKRFYMITVSKPFIYIGWGIEMYISEDLMQIEYIYTK